LIREVFCRNQRAWFVLIDLIKRASNGRVHESDTDGLHEHVYTTNANAVLVFSYLDVSFVTPFLPPLVLYDIVRVFCGRSCNHGSRCCTALSFPHCSTLRLKFCARGCANSLFSFCRSSTHTGSRRGARHWLSDSSSAITNDKDSVIDLARTVVSRGQDSWRIVSHYIVSGRDCDGYGTFSQVCERILGCKICHNAHSSIRIFGGVVHTRSFRLSCVGVCIMWHNSPVTNKVPTVWHPATITALVAVVLTKFLNIFRRACSAVNKLLLWETDGRD
jgi:hypothetical protein